MPEATSTFNLFDLLDDAVWTKATPARLEYGSLKYDARPELSTSVRILWSDQWLYFGWECPYTKLTVFDNPSAERERLGLWDRDVIEAFIGTDLAKTNHYAEYELAPTNERLDVMVNLPGKDFNWDGRAQSAVKSRTVTLLAWRAASNNSGEYGFHWAVDPRACWMVSMT